MFSEIKKFLKQENISDKDKFHHLAILGGIDSGKTEKYGKYYFWNYNMALNNKFLTDREVKRLGEGLNIQCIIKRKYSRIKYNELVENINNDSRIPLEEKQNLLCNIPFILDTVPLEKWIILIKESDKEIMEKHFVGKGYYSIFLENTSIGKL